MVLDKTLFGSKFEGYLVSILCLMDNGFRLKITRLVCMGHPGFNPLFNG